MSDGRIVIANAGTGELLRYEADGEFLGSAGNRGEGPGEFESLGWLGRSAEDSLLTWDLALNRVTVFSGEGAYVRDYPIALPDAMAGAVALGTIDGRRLVLSRGASFNPVNGAGVQRQPLSAWVVSSGGQPETEFGPFPGESVELRGGRQPGTTIRTRIPFGTTSLIAVGQDRLAVTDNGRVDVHVYTADGRLFEVLRRPHSPLPLTPEDLAADLDARLARVPPIEEIRAGIRASYEAVPKPEFLPAVRSMRIDQTGCVWVEAGRHVEDTAAHWSIFSPDGAWLTDITLSAELTPLEAGVDYLLALRTDELGVESVLLMDLARG